MKKNKTWARITDIVGVALTVIMAFAGWYVGIIGVLIVWAIARSVFGRTDSGGLIGVEQQSQARGKRPRRGNGGAGYQTFVPPSHR